MKTRLGTMSGLNNSSLMPKEDYIVVSKSFEANNGLDPARSSLEPMQRRGLCRSNLHKLHLNILRFGPPDITYIGLEK